MSLQSSISPDSSRHGLTPTAYARRLLDSLDLPTLEVGAEVGADYRSPSQLWAQSGAMWLSGHADASPRHCPAPLAACAQGAWLALAAVADNQLDPGFEAFRLLGERAAIAGLTRCGRTAPGGACQLLATADGALALNLPREDDVDLLPAWLQHPLTDTAELAALLRRRNSGELVARARLLGLAAAEVAPPQPVSSWYRSTQFGPVAAGRRRDKPLVIDLSALWAGPLCAQLLASCGARVIKVESVTRPDGARSGPPAFYDLMNCGKESVALDLAAEQGRLQLQQLLSCADIVIESARPRGLEQMGIYAADILAANPGMVWLGITGYGRRSPMREWIAYGDDAGVAAGLSWLMGGDRGDPVFAGDAIADPLTGLHAALLAWSSWVAGGGRLLDISLHDVVAHCIAAGTAQLEDPVSEHPVPAPERPVARPARSVAAPLGADTERVLRELLSGSR